MKINLSKIDKEEFSVYEKQLNGETVFLVQPKEAGVHWSKETLIFRSSLWNSDGELISAGFPKFFNWGENFQLSPIPTNLDNSSILEKLDGSLLIVSKYKGNFILRTRGVADATIHKNSNELEILKEKHPKIFEVEDRTWNHSILFEWISPTNKIILNYGPEVDFFLVGVVKHEDYSLLSQKSLDLLAKDLNIKRPKRYFFNSIDEMITIVKDLKNAEGVVVYTNGDQTLHKAKGLWYLALHRMKEGLSSIDKVIDVWLSYKKPNYNDFYQRIYDQFDFEIAEYCKDSLLKVCEASKKVGLVLEEIKINLESIKVLPRKEQALKILSLYKSSHRTGIAFNILDGKEIDDRSYKQLLLQIIEVL